MNMNVHVKTRGAPDFARDPRIVVFPKEIQRSAGVRVRAPMGGEGSCRTSSLVLRTSPVHQLIGGQLMSTRVNARLFYGLEMVVDMLVHVEIMLTSPSTRHLMLISC